MKVPAPVYALGAAFLFAAGIPATKVLVASTDPKMVAGLLYIGSGFGLSCLLLCRELFGGKRLEHTVFNKADFPWLFSATTLGGIIAPLALMFSMLHTPASTVSLLLNFEILFTALVACIFFKERLSGRAIVGLIAILLGGACLSGSSVISGSWWALLAILAALLWAVDSNFAGRISRIDPLQIARFKGLLAGTFNLSLAFALGGHFPNIAVVAGAAITGMICYGLSLSLFIIAIRDIGAARAVAYFSTEPFIGALLSVLILKEGISVNLIVAGILMVIGIYLHLTEKHPHIEAVLEEEAGAA
ncbi:MAG TPA: DMT family transporter [Planktothrix sp.]